MKNMKQYLFDFMINGGYTEDEMAALLSAFDTFSLRAGDLLAGMMHAYEADMHCDLLAQMEMLTARAEEIGLHPYTLHLLLFLCHTRAARTYYEIKGIDLSIYNDTFADLKYKLRECRLVKGIFGTFVGAWFVRHFWLERFALGRLQFETEPFGHHYEKNGHVLTPHDERITLHIPRSLKPFDAEARRDSYRRAVDFFGCRDWDHPVAFTCHSWLLYPPMAEALNKTSNTYSFYKEFYIASIEPNEKGHGDLWRLFDMDEPENLADLPADTSMRRAIRDFVLAGNRTGEALGIFFADEAGLL